MIAGFTDVSSMLRCGVYLLAYRGQIVYIGKSKAMLTRVYTHRSLARGKQLPWLRVRGVVFDEVWVMPVHPDRLDATERALILEHQPRYNIVHNPLAAIASLPVVERRI